MLRTRAPAPSRARWPLVLAAAALVVGAAACESARARVESFPPVVCYVHGGGGAERTATVEVDGPPSSVEVGQLTFFVEYRSSDSGRVLEAAVWRSPDEFVERVTYVVPGRNALDNQFGPGPSRLTGEHEVMPRGVDGLVWSCAVGSGTTTGESPP